jgi:hypothetical protein
MRVEKPSILKAGGLGLPRQTNNAFNGNVRLQRNAKLHGELLVVLVTALNRTA